MARLRDLLPLRRRPRGTAQAAPPPPIRDYQADYIRRLSRVDRVAAREVMRLTNKYPFGPDKIILTESNTEARQLRRKLRGRGYHVKGGKRGQET